MTGIEIFIDAEYVLQSLRDLKDKPKSITITKDKFNWVKFVDLIAQGRSIANTNYYTARLDKKEDAEKYNDQTEYLQKTEESLNVYNIKMRLGKMIKTRLKSKSTWNKDRKRKSTSESVHSWVQKGIDTKIVLDLCHFAYTADKSKENIAIIVTGDSDFSETLKRLRDLQIKTELVVFNRFGHQSKDLMKAVSSVTVLGYAQLQEAEII